MTIDLFLEDLGRSQVEIIDFGNRCFGSRASIHLVTLRLGVGGMHAWQRRPLLQEYLLEIHRIKLQLQISCHALLVVPVHRCSSRLLADHLERRDRCLSGGNCHRGPQRRLTQLVLRSRRNASSSRSSDIVLCRVNHFYLILF